MLDVCKHTRFAEEQMASTDFRTSLLSTATGEIPVYLPNKHFKMGNQALSRPRAAHKPPGPHVCDDRRIRRVTHSITCFTPIAGILVLKSRL